MAEWDLHKKVELYVETAYGRSLWESALLRCSQQPASQAEEDAVFDRQVDHVIVNRNGRLYHPRVLIRRAIFVAAELSGETAQTALQGFGLFYLDWCDTWPIACMGLPC